MVLDQRYYAEYEVVVSKRPVISLYSTGNASDEMRYSGTFEACFTAYDPFAHMRMISYDGEGDPAV